MKCSNCKQIGHNKRSCTKDKAVAPLAPPTPPAPPVKKEKNDKRGNFKVISRTRAMVKTSQSKGLSKRLNKMVEDGRRLNDDSSSSEKTLNEAMREIVPYATELFKPTGLKIVSDKTISLYECQKFLEKVDNTYKPNPENKKVTMKPDGGILFAVSKKERIPLLIVEDKVQGTNDLRLEQKKKKQATGNAIERAGKNIRGAEMIFAGSQIFPYVIFASGCDFHTSETIAKRIEMMNMGVPNHYVDIATTTTDEQIKNKIDALIPAIKLEKLCGKGIASVFVKAHKWNEMKHGASLWKKDEQVKILKKVVDIIFESMSTSLTPST